ncbi:GNAT family N-acetyltransferase [Micromonosporaceae bacterium Da 78-11]
MTFDLEPLLANSRSYWLGWGHLDADTVLYRSGVADSQLNGVLRRDDRPFDEALADARLRLDGVPWLWWVGPDSARLLIGHGAEKAYEMPVMAVDLDRVAPTPQPAGLVVDEPRDLREWVTAYTPSFGMGADLVDDVTVAEAAMRGRLTRFEGRLDGQVVGTSALWESDGVAGVYVVTVDERYRRRGIGAAMTAAALQRGRESGLRIGTLQATGAGMPVYQRMGFGTAGRYDLYAV